MSGRQDEQVTLRVWTTFWDRANHRVLLLGNRLVGEKHWSFVKRDEEQSRDGEYDIWRTEAGAVVIVEVKLDASDRPIGFPGHLVPEDLLGSPTIWPSPELLSFVWWSDRRGFIAED